MASLAKIIGILLVIAAAGYGGIHLSRKSAENAEAKAAADSRGSGGSETTATAPRALPVEVVEAIDARMDYRIPATGTIVASESVDISSEQSRRLVEILVTEGADVKAGDVLFRLDAADLKARLKELQARLEQAKREAQRRASLLRDKAVSESDYDAAATEVSILDAQIEQVQSDTSKTEIRAPFDGRVGLKRVSVGAWVTPSLVLTTLQDTRTMKVDFKVPERYAATIKPGMDFRFRPEGSGDWREGKVVASEPEID